MQNESLRSLSNEDLLSETRALAESERRISVRILHHLAEIDRRRAFVKAGFPSLWEYALRELKYSESQAYRRIAAMRALVSVPELEEKIAAGALSVTTVSQVQTFLKAEREQLNKVVSKTERAELFKKCENKSTREVTRELLAISPSSAIQVRKERTISENRTVISFIADQNLVDKIHRVRDLSVPKMKDPASYPELVEIMSEVTLNEIDPLRKPDKCVALIAPQPTQKVKRFIPVSMRRRVWKEFGGRCAFVDPETGLRCNSTFALEIEHCKPFALGGDSEETNLRLLCRTHNQWQAIQTYGAAKMEQHLRRNE